MKWHNTIERLQKLDRRSLFLITLAAALIYLLSFQFWKQPSEADRANWDYISQVIARGGVPYRDVVNIKTPLSAYIGAAAIVTTRPLGLRDIFAIRIAYLLLAALTVGYTYLVALDYFQSQRVALLAAAIMMAFKVFGETNSGGVQSKTPMVLFGLMTLWAIQKNRAFQAGAFGMFSALSWQPGLLFAGAAGLAFSRYLTNWRDLKAFKVIAGAALPLAITVVYFWSAGALRDFYVWNIDFNYNVYGPQQSRSPAEFLDRLSRMLDGAFKGERFYFYLAAAGIAVALVQELRRVIKEGRQGLVDRATYHAVLIAPLVYFAFCMINIQGAADLIPLLPFIAIFAALALIRTVDFMGDIISRQRSASSGTTPGAWAFAAVLTVVMTLNAFNALFYRVAFPTLKDQEADIAEMTSRLEPGDKIFVQGASQILVLSGLTNASRHYFLDRGKDSYLDHVEPGGFAGWFARLKAERPKLVAIDRTKNVDHRDEFVDWVRTDYDEHSRPVFTYYLRKDSSSE